MLPYFGMSLPPVAMLQDATTCPGDVARGLSTTTAASGEACHCHQYQVVFRSHIQHPTVSYLLVSLGIGWGLAIFLSV